MPDYKHALCLFCRTGKEARVVDAIHDRGLGRAIFPERVHRVYDHRQHKYREESAPFLPGYVFLYLTDEPELDALTRLDHVIRLLGKGDGRQDYLLGSDRVFADWLWQQAGVVGKLPVFEEGDRIEIASGIFKELQGEIRRVDHRKGTCLVVLNTDGIIRDIWLPYEILQKTAGSDR